MNEVEKVIYDNLLYAIILRHNFDCEGVKFFTDGAGLLEFGYMSHPVGHNIQPHKHHPYERTTFGTQEVLYIKKGRVQVDFYSATNDNFIGTEELLCGDWILFTGGGHGFKMLEPSVMIEVKNGPYAADGDKTRFFPVSPK